MAILVWRFSFPRSGPPLFCGLIESCGCFSKTLHFFAPMWNILSILCCENRDFGFTWNVGLAPSVYLILFYAMEYIVKRLLLCFSSSQVPQHKKNVVTIALTAKFKPICHLNKRNSLQMSACIWHQNLWKRSKAVSIGPLIYAELLLFSLKFRHELTPWVGSWRRRRWPKTSTNNYYYWLLDS